MGSERILAIDIGNTCIKCYLFDKDNLIDKFSFNCTSATEAGDLLKSIDAGSIIYCSVRKSMLDITTELEQICGIPVMGLNPFTPLPFEMKEEWRVTMGADRIAAMAGGMAKYGSDFLVVDAGTAVTADYVRDGIFLGGNISPGLFLRFKSLNDFASLLPMVESTGDLPQFGYDTETAIRAGVVGGLAAEIKNEYMNAAKGEREVRLLLTGGDAAVLVSPLKEMGLNPFMDTNLVGIGLKYISLYNNKIITS